MKILYTYDGARNSVVEHAVLEDLGARFGAVSQVASCSGEDGMTTVTLEGPDDQSIVEALRQRPEVVEAARESFGEGV